MYNPIEVSQAAAKAREELEKSGQVGYTEGTVELTWDGNTETTTVIDGMPLLSRTVYDPKRLISITMNDGYVFTKDMVTFENVEGFASVVYNELVLLISIPGYGTFGYIDSEGVFTAKVVFDGTIHPIDPKFLPGVCLPVVELSTSLSTEGDGEVLTEAESEQMNEVFATGLPIIVKGSVGGVPIATIATLTTSDDNDIAYIYNAMGYNLYILKVDGIWKAIANIPLE